MKTDPAFPVRNSNEFMSGLTKREYFAVMAMQGILAKEGWAERICSEGGDMPLKKQIAGAAVFMADELLKNLENEPNV